MPPTRANAGMSSQISAETGELELEAAIISTFQA